MFLSAQLFNRAQVIAPISSGVAGGACRRGHGGRRQRAGYFVLDHRGLRRRNLLWPEDGGGQSLGMASTIG